jgi:hypothetical protein
MAEARVRRARLRAGTRFARQTALDCPTLLTPVEALLLGVVAGLVATFALSVLARIVPGMSNLTQKPGTLRAHEKKGQPSDPFDPEIVQAWQDHARCPGATKAGLRDGAFFTAEGALVKTHGPGPEGAAAEFAVKLVAGLFGRDITASAKRAGKVVHFAYGSFWGGVYGLMQASLELPWFAIGAAHGLFVWAIGPGWLAPMMKVMLAPRTLRAHQNVLLIAAHVLYGLLVAAVFGWLAAWRTS